MQSAAVTEKWLRTVHVALKDTMSAVTEHLPHMMYGTQAGNVLAYMS